MNRATNWLVAILALSACATDSPDGISTTASSFHIDRTERADDGVPYFVKGTLGVASKRITDLADVEAALASALPEIGRAIRVPSEQLYATRLEHDELGMTHVRFAQRANSLPVIGGNVIVHLDSNGVISSVTNGARDASTLSSTPEITPAAAADVARARTIGAIGATAPDLVYVITNGEGDIRLAWRTDVRGPMLHDTVFVDAISGEVVARHPHIQPVRNRTIYTGGDIGLQIEPTLVGTETSPPTETIAKIGFDNSGTVYDCYKTLFNRDSYDGLGAELVAVVNMKNNGAALNNAFWGGDVMVYGTGDGVEFGNFVRALDVSAHEMTHGVVQESAGLVYQLESGALNEASADILGVACEHFKTQTINANTWKIGEDIYTPATAGDALRYMNNPTLDGPIYNNQIYSTDYYPERHKLAAGETPGSGNDQGYVHFNSGIANLAFYLMVQGGNHPRNKTTYTVVGVGMDKASKVWYRALNNYMTTNTTFAQARTATEMAATDLYPGPTRTAISMAWATVGVGAPPTADTSPPAVTITAPAKGATVQPSFIISANAYDDQGVLKVDFKVDGQLVGTSNSPPYTITTEPLAAGTHTIEAIAYDAINKTSDTAMVTIVDPTCGNTCSAEQTCDMNTGTCVDKPEEEDGGGCCSTSNDSAVSGLLLFAGLGLVLRRRRRR
jgi:MYXO-CTERM domain-containing protein